MDYYSDICYYYSDKKGLVERMTTKQASEKWGISDRRIRLLCQQNKIPNAELIGKTWYLPDDAKKPKDGRMKTNQNLLNKIIELKNQLDEKRPFTEGELQKLNEQFAIEYIYNSNAIEGNTLTLRETEMVLRGLTIDQKPLKDHMEAIGHKEAFDYVCDLVKQKTQLNQHTIKNIHYLVLADKRQDRGVYRKIPVMIMGAKHVPPQPYSIEPKIEQLLLWYNEENSENFITKLARFHVEFEGIHPFIDGNGRTGRLLVNLELMKLGYPPIDIKYIDRMAYYAAFDSYHTKGDLGPMINLFSKYIYERLEFYLSLLNEVDK